jgi:hypothetical protein
MRKDAKKILPGKDVPGMNATHSRRAHPGDSRNRKFFLLKPPMLFCKKGVGHGKVCGN